MRFGAPYPKELHRTASGTSLIDYALAPVLDLHAKGIQIRVVVVLTPEKLSTAAYLARYSDRLDVAYTFQEDRHGPELAGAVTAGLPWCRGPAALMLPDQKFDWSPAANPLEQAFGRLRYGAWAVIAAWTSDPDVLRNDGALCVGAGDPPVVEASVDKPSDPAGFNAAWVALACREGELLRLPSIVGGEENLLVGASAVFVSGYRNVSTPELAHG